MHEQMPVGVTITEIVEETPSIRTFVFDREIAARPGQFVMVWVPGVDEIPMALSSPSSITVLEVGDATAALCAMHEGDRIGIRGPYGNGFTVSGRTLAIGGGVGASPLLPLVTAGQVDTFLLGARTASELLFADRIREAATLMIATDDGTAGHHGFVTQLISRVDLTDFAHICVCGPEVMMAAVLAVLDREGCAERGQFSLHRYMKCGVGVCGSCCTDPHGLRVCRDGPVFSGDVLLDSEFGHYMRDASGSRHGV
ncbi:MULTISPECIES: dihydroorotate dehydrogenase electron transfer subunit [unclassified Methanoculleus]|uniref:dihydroorotate dehydrogenase electron transfer subunit n=1 Tax=unclassified Methanoculleus TaxID=2619537 RepID=UPI0025FBAEE1|nr:MULTISPECIES: dihydroorotate dehydrogenase electron transfer subunit [unclassified Methanoculleus]MCK9316952.1 dihydroorotate dehydrogenase electron transfer subunit [Methanoculleus sp.]MDD2252828.1 dihydroorotate dehydrogenase electron transfer subunit [Methanoculleus sp.]MDD2787870.1 dihydroorotate dehydrogenase electron transfer subunit [Methanoculleus sp.]MDD3215755.1 dihydroorotate dehydrogenase electron transfer subunit [Methanoculleus sp.]MDD4313486.1 dihydroorotate dehydrogenase ele